MWLTLLTFFAGLALPLAFAPFNFYPIAFLSPAILLWSFLRSTPWQATYRGYFFGIGFFSVGTSWVYISIHNFGNASIFLSIFITALLILFLALYFALAGYLSRQLFQKKSIVIQSLCIFPALWVAMEALRAWLFTGFPWLLLGDSQLNTPLAPLAPIVGVYGLSLAVCFVSGALVILATPMKKISPKIIATLLIILLMSAGWSLQGRYWTEATKTPLTVSLVQGNIAQKMKWKPDELMNILEIYQNMTSTLWDSQLIIWPEAAVPIFPQDVDDYFSTLNSLVKQHHNYLIVGSPLFDASKKQFYNGLQMMGAYPGIYYKRHLVPFGEYTPLPSVFHVLMKKLNIPMSDFSKGPKEQEHLKINNIQIAAFICYEIAFSREILQYSKGAQLLINLSDDSWFGRSIALHQQLQMAQLRALETGRPILSTTNTGITAIINPLGKITASLPIDQRAVLRGIVMPMTGETPLMRWNYYPVIILIVLLFLFGNLFPSRKSY